eukprot:8875948-Pyramimonas_sp.AAC.2
MGTPSWTGVSCLRAVGFTSSKPRRYDWGCPGRFEVLSMFRSEFAYGLTRSDFWLRHTQLKEYLKEHKLPQNGEKEAQISRIQVHIDGQATLVDGVHPYRLAPAALRKVCTSACSPPPTPNYCVNEARSFDCAARIQAVAQRGLNPMGDKDELVKLLVDSLKSEQPGSKASGATPLPPLLDLPTRRMCKRAHNR